MSLNVIDSSEEPEEAASAVQRALEPDGIPVEEPPDTFVELPGGFLTQEGRLLRTAEVRELTGEDEEALSRGGASSNAVRYIQTLLNRAVVSIDGVTPDKMMIQALLVGDRTALLLGIRRATYGDDVEMSLTCPKCGEQFDVAIELDKDVEVRRLEDPLKREYEIPLRRGHVATIRLPIGADQEASYGDDRRSQAERNTGLLLRIVTKIDGRPVFEEQIRQMGLVDRRTILDWLVEHQPGPLLGEVAVPCEHCGETSTVGLDLMDLFR